MPTTSIFSWLSAKLTVKVTKFISAARTAIVKVSLPLAGCAVSQRHLDPERSKPWRPYLSHDRIEKVQPGEAIPVEIEILPSSTFFEAGETLRLVVSGRDILEFARFGHDETVNQGRHELHAGGAHPSYLLIPFC